MCWRKLGITYIEYSLIAAKSLRRSLKPEPRREALKRNICSVRIRKWENGKPGEFLKIATRHDKHGPSDA